jgi:hypothetical protein
MNGRMLGRTAESLAARSSQLPGPLTGSLKSLKEGIADHAPLEHYIG